MARLAKSMAESLDRSTSPRQFDTLRTVARAHQAQKETYRLSQLGRFVRQFARAYCGSATNDRRGANV
jgi:hypothetical protein